MAARLEKETTKVHLHLYTEDLETFDAALCRQGVRTVGRSKGLRELFHAFAQTLRRRTDAKPVKFDPTITDIISD